MKEKTLTEAQVQKAALAEGLEYAALKAVALVESGPLGGFLAGGEPVILFEGHVFWRELRMRGLDPARLEKGHEDILFPTWDRAKYGPVAAQHGRLRRAAALHREAALSSASWGLFQIMGFNWRLCGFESLQKFINAMYRDEAAHLEAFLGFLKGTGLMAALRARDWPALARGYNGPGYAANQYDIRLAQAYQKAAEVKT